MMALRECARIEMTMCKCAVSNDMCVQESVLQETTMMAKTTDNRMEMPERCCRTGNQNNQKGQTCRTRRRMTAKIATVFRRLQRQTKRHRKPTAGKRTGTSRDKTV